MTKIYSSFYLSISFLFLFVNGSGLGFIIYQIQLGEEFGLAMFIFTSLVGALFTTFEMEQKQEYYSRLFFYSHLIITLLPLYYYGIMKLM
ncbi:hypothetical protein ACNRWW_07275 [Metabacillus sp. HB246100]|uniref:hypothetical protein n=1 Tax=Bacillus weihaiensis TaxID=1547283 RepID=UPI00235702BC|nr:hypothetical protein [Bacillus weihaiensis]